ncbi:MAG: hypothetical protein QM324_10465 [Bacteroidota bacterium]|jgi:hypothetical protein|nr:hypothetical protein [Bacteroidota bacterium]
MKSHFIVLFSILAILVSCQSGKNAEQALLKPEIRYELSGGAGHYDYAPSFIRDKYGIIYGFLCENRDPFKIVDYVYLYKGIPTKDGYVWQKGTQIIEPSADGWDNCHICDPDVREFRTKWKGETYDWIMTYLGVDQWDCNHNQIGLAVSKCIEGPYIKYDGNPIVPYEGRDKWGTGQSTSIVLNDSTIVLYYHSTTENGPYARREIVLNDLDNIRLGEEEKIPNLSGNSYPMYSDKYIYMVSEMRTEGYDNSMIPTWVGDWCRVARMPIDGDIHSEEDRWEVIGNVFAEDSGFPRNHNPGFLTDSKGYMPDNDQIVVYFTPAVTGESWLWSYDLYSATFNLNNK